MTGGSDGIFSEMLSNPTVSLTLLQLSARNWNDVTLDKTLSNWDCATPKLDAVNALEAEFQVATGSTVIAS